MIRASIPRAFVVLTISLLLLLGTNALMQAQTAIATIPVGNLPQGVAVNPVTNFIYVANVASDNVSVINGVSNAVVASIAVAMGTAPSSIALNPNTNRIYVANALGNNVSVIDGGTNVVIATVNVGAKPSGVAVNPSTNRIYVSNRETSDISVIDGNTNTVITTVVLGGASPLDVALNPNTNRIYIANAGANNVLVMDGATNTVIATVPIGNLPTGLAVNTTTDRIYVANSGIGINDVSVINGTTNAVIATIPVGTNPRTVAVNTTTNRIYATNQGTNTVSIIDGVSNTVVSTLSVGSTPQGVAANLATNRFYVANNGGNTVSVVQDVTPTPPTSTSTPITPTPTPTATQPVPFPFTSTWYFAEGSTQPPFDTWFLVENPSSSVANVTFTFHLQPSGVVVQNYLVGPTSRFSLFANQALPNVAFSTRIDSNVPVYAERAMYVGYDGDVITGIPAPNTVWLFAEGASVPPFHTWLLLQNPNNTVATATITYFLETGQTVTQLVGLPPTSRTSVFVNGVLPNAAFSSRVQSDLPIIAERAMYRFPGNAATDNSGVNAPALDWYFSEGRTSYKGMSADTFLLLENQNSALATANITLYGTDGRTTAFPVAVQPTSRLTVYLNPLFTGSFGIKVNSNLPVIAERSIFFGNEPKGAYSTQGTTHLNTMWHLAEGETRSPFEELITILNPHGTVMSVHIDFELQTGQVISRDFSVGANSKLEINVGNILTGANSANVTTSLPSVVERTMFIYKLGHVGAHDTIGAPVLLLTTP